MWKTTLGTTFCSPITVVTVTSGGGSPWHPWFKLSSEWGSSLSACCHQWPHPQSSIYSQGPLSSRALWPLPVRLEEARYGVYSPMEKRQASCVGCYLPDTFAPSYSTLTSLEADLVAAQVEERKRSIYLHFTSDQLLIPVAIETNGVVGAPSMAFLKGLGRCLEQDTGESRCQAYHSVSLSCHPKRQCSFSLALLSYWLSWLWLSLSRLFLHSTAWFLSLLRLTLFS